jgi:glycosyltransferase involved in cell wall biosynthesis
MIFLSSRTKCNSTELHFGTIQTVAGATHNPLVSVVIPCYNKGAFLGEAIQSVLAQTYRNYEIIIVDDGSNDSTSTVAQQYPAARYFHQANRGPGDARNHGFHESKGNNIVFLDADDRLLHNALEEGVRHLETNDSLAFVSGHVQLISEDGGLIRIPEESCIQNNHYRTLLHYNYIWTPAAVMFRRFAIETAGGFSRIRWGTEDWDLYLRVARVSTVYCHEKIVAEYRIYKNQLSSDCAYMLKESMACLREQRPYVKGDLDLENAYFMGIQEVKSYFGEPLVQRIYESLRASQWRQGIRDMGVLLRYDPRRFSKHALKWLSFQNQKENSN